MKFFLLISMIFMLSSTKSADGGCNLTGTWLQVIKIPGEPEAFGLKMELLKDGSMKMAGITGSKWRVKDDCTVF